MIKKILVPTDFTEASRPALQRGEELALLLKAELVVLHVREDLPSMLDGAGVVPSELWADEQAVSEARLGDLVDALRARGVTAHAVQAPGVPEQQILRRAEREGVDMIVMGTHGRHGVSSLMLGSVAERVARASNLPVVIVREPARSHEATSARATAKDALLLPRVVRPMRTILAPTDFEASGGAALAYAFELAERFGASVHIVHACPRISARPWSYGRTESAPFEEQLAIERLGAVVRRYGASPALGSSIVERGEPGQVILATAVQLDADLVVLCTHRRGSLAGVSLGSVADHVVRQASCPVLVIKTQIVDELGLALESV